MKNWVEKISSVFIILFYLILTGLYFMGLIHSYKKHSAKDFVLTICLPPFTLYRGAESFWHVEENEDNVENVSEEKWDDIVKADIRTSLQLINMVTEVQSIDKTNTQISLFSKKISTYPKDRLNKIKSAAQTYIYFCLNMTEDMKLHFSKIYDLGDTTPFLFSSKTKQEYDSLYFVYGISDMKFIKETMDSLERSISSDSLVRNDKSISYTMIENSTELLNNCKIIYRTAYLRLFKEDLKF